MVYQTLVPLLGLLTLANCRITPGIGSSTHPDEMQGLYEMGLEPRGFRLCDKSVDGGIWRPVQLPSDVSIDNWPGTPTGMSAVMAYVRWRAELAPVVKGGTGNARAVIVREVLEVRAARSGDCGWK